MQKRMVMGAAWAATLVTAALALAPAARAAEGMIGWRGDGTGAFPADCRVPDEWSESKNVVWKAPLPNAGNGSPVAVGRKVFVMCEPGYRSDAPLLVCLDADTGRELWQRAVDHFDLLPPGERAKAVALRKEWFEAYRTGMKLNIELQAAKTEAAKAAIQQRMEAAGISKIGFGHPSFTRSLSHLGAFAKAYNWVGPTWGWLPIGSTFPTPASDGRHVFVVTAFNVVACYDLDGNRKWIEWFRSDTLAYHEVARFVHSPILVDGRLIVMGNRRLRAFDPETGQRLWDIETGMQLYMTGTPVVMEVAGAKAVATPSGEVVRVSDGRVLADRIGLFAAGAMILSDGKDRLFGRNGRSGGAYKCPEDRLFALDHAGDVVAVRLVPDGPGKTRPELLWALPDKGEDVGVYRDGVIYIGTRSIDAATGAYRKNVRGRARSDQGWILVDGKLIGSAHDGTMPVVSVPEMKPIATNQLDPIPPELTPEKRDQISGLATSLETGKWYVWNFGRSLPFASGNRLFLRSFDALYAVGEPGSTFRPSAAFEAK